MAEPTLFLFDRWDDPLGPIRPVGAVAHREELGGEDVLDFETLHAPEKGERVVWLDPDDDVWREHEVVRTEDSLSGPARVHAEGSLCELLRDVVVEAQLVSRTAEQALAAVLAPTRWAVGECGTGGATASTLIYHSNALAALRRVEAVWGCEAEAAIEVADGRISRRTVNLPAKRGAWRGARMQYGVNLAGCTRTVLSDEVYTALYGWGKGLPIEDEEGAPTGGYTRRLSFSDVNGGVRWVGDDEARERWGRWDAERGQRVHAFGQVVFPECEDAGRLLELTRAALAEASAPKVSYECDAAFVRGGGPVRLGDDVAVTDLRFLRDRHLLLRCVRREREFGAGGAVRRRLTLGATVPASWEELAVTAAGAVEAKEAATAAGDVAAAAAEAAASVSYEDLSDKEF